MTRLKSLKNSYLCIEDFARFDRIGGITKDKAGSNFVLFYTFYFHFDVLAAGHFGHLNVVRPHLVHLHLRSVGVNGQSLALFALARLNFADHHRSHVRELVDDGHHEGAVAVALQRGQIVNIWNEWFLPV